MLSAQTKDEMKLSSTAALLDTTETPASPALSSAVAGRASACWAPGTELSHHNGCKCAPDNYQTALLLSLLRLLQDKAGTRPKSEAKQNDHFWNSRAGHHTKWLRCCWLNFFWNSTEMKCDSYEIVFHECQMLGKFFPLPHSNLTGN